MTEISQLLPKLLQWIPTILVLSVGLVFLLLFRHLLMARAAQKNEESKLGHQVFMLLLTGIVVLAIILAMPISDTTRGQILSLLGIFLAAAISLSSTTFLGNIMAGLMLRAVENMRPGDFVKVGEHFGRVTERGLLHTEIQTEHRDLTTLPNIYLVNNPVQVVRSSGTVISATVSLGYDVHHEKVIDVMEAAAASIGLENPFVHVMELNDHSVTFKVAGFLKDVKSLISFRSQLRGAVLDALHDAKIEIVSPTFMNQRIWDAGHHFIPRPFVETQPNHIESMAPEAVIFDKAEEAETLEQLKFRQKDLAEITSQLKKELGETEDEKEKFRLQARLNQTERQLDQVRTWIEQRNGKDATAAS